jgi:hypothetical protein
LNGVTLFLHPGELRNMI